jgi:monofunctional biosynthetic peptidoglycan transglycosylase
MRLRRFVKRRKKGGCLRQLLGLLLKLCLVWLAIFFGGLFLYRAADPPVTGVQLQRRVGAAIDGREYRQDSRFVPLSSVSEHLQHAVIAAEDGRFYQHSGVDWQEVGKVIEEELPKGRMRGASTITQQLVKNLFMTTHPIPLRKPMEWFLAPAADRILGKDRTLELYLNVVEWGPGVFGAEAASQYHYKTSAARLSREQSARLAAVLPSPLRWRPERMDKYSAIILEQMEKRGW